MSERKDYWPSGLPNPLPGDNPIRDDPGLRKALCLDWTLKDRDAYVGTFEIVKIRQRVHEKQNIKLWVLEETPDVDKFKTWLREREEVKKDKRAKYVPPFSIGEMEWQYTVKRDQSVILVDADNNEIVGVVIRNFVGDQRVLKYINEVVEAHMSCGIRDIRRDDLGKMIQYGYTNGEKSSSALDWVAIAKRKKNNMDRSPQDMAELMHSHCSVHNLMWNMYLRKAPPEIMDKFKHDTQKMLKMDWNMGGDPLGQDPVISLKLDDGWYELSKGIELGPPGGAFANYYSKHSHFESNQQRFPWALSLASSYDIDKATTLGGNFYFWKYRVKVLNDVDTVLFHRQDQWHGTTPHEQFWSKNVDPEKAAMRAQTKKVIDEPRVPAGSRHQGLTMYISGHSAELWEKAVEKSIKQSVTPRQMLIEAQMDHLEVLKKRREKKKNNNKATKEATEIEEGAETEEATGTEEDSDLSDLELDDDVVTGRAPAEEYE